jgi:hypothetical protein
VGPVGIAPSFESGERFVEGAAEVGELVKGGRLDPTGVEVAHHKAVTLGSSERVSEHFMRNTVERVVEFLVAATSVLQFGENGEGPSTVDETDDALR